MKSINAKGIEIGIISRNEDDYISLTDIARFKGSQTGIIIAHWLSTRYTVQLMGIWEQLHNPDFNITEFSYIKNESGSNGFVLSVKTWREKLGGIGIIAKTGRYHSGTFAHQDIAFEFASWISPEFKLYLIKEFQRLKYEESERISTGWDVKRTLSKMNYRIHTDAIKKNLIPGLITANEKNMIYANEADILNMAIFGTTASAWAKVNPKKDGNLRDYASVEQLVVLANLESLNAEFIKSVLPQSIRLGKLNAIAIYQMSAILGTSSLRKLTQQSRS